MWRLVEKPLEPPFPIRRVYYLVDTKDDRGGHSHKALNQVAIAVTGSVTFVLEDRETGRSEITLNTPDGGLLIGPGTWREMTGFSSDCVLLVLADSHYDESDYIRDYDEFKRGLGPLPPKAY